MNWLAHILLSKCDIEYQLGNLLADPLKGRLWETASSSLIEGVNMHKSIDMFTDSHPYVSTCKSRLGNKGYLKGVIVDILFDHFLTLEWSKYSNVPLGLFIEDFHVNAISASKEYPVEARRFIERVVYSSMLSSYGSMDGFVKSLERIESRLSPRIREKDSAMRYIPVVERNYVQMREDFDVFFPELVLFFKQHKLGEKGHSFLL